MTHKKIKTSLWGLFLMLLCTQCTLDTTEEVLTDFEQIRKESRVADIDFPEKVDTFFINQVQDSTLLKLIHRFKSNLKDSAEIETLNQYVQSYGYPLWEQFFYTRLDEGFLYAVPVAKDGGKSRPSGSSRSRERGFIRFPPIGRHWAALIGCMIISLPDCILNLTLKEQK